MFARKYLAVALSVSALDSDVHQTSSMMVTVMDKDTGSDDEIGHILVNLAVLGDGAIHDNW